MSAQSFERWADSLVQEGIISREDAGLYSYGLEQGLLLLLNIGTALLIGLLLDEFVACVIFLACFLPLRAMAGGYHARTPLRCYLLGMMLVTAAMLASKWIPWTITGTWITAAVACVIIWRLAPAEDKNKPLNKKEREKYSQQTEKILIITLWGIMLTYMAGWNKIGMDIDIALWGNVLMLCLWKMKSLEMHERV